MANPSSVPFQTLTGCLNFANEAELQWWMDSGSLFARMLQLADYNTHQQYQHLLFFHRYVIPYFGPYPPKWKTILTKSGAPIEYSLNFQQSSNPVIRMSFEPLNEESGTTADFFNKKPSEQLVAEAVKNGLNLFDMALFDHFAADIFISDAEIGNIPDVAEYPIKTHTGLGFDLKGDDVVVKGYVLPRWKSISTGVPVSTLVKESINRIKDRLDCAQAFDLLDEFLDQTGSYNLHTFLAWDCTSINKSRLKIYGVDNQVSLPTIENIWTMGGRLTDASATQGLKLLERFWELLDIDQTPRHYAGGEEKHLDFGPEKTLPFFWNYEIKSGCNRPFPKIYFPVYGENDFKVALAVSRFFASLGWEDKARSYIGTLPGARHQSDHELAGIDLVCIYREERCLYECLLSLDH
ncbi:aromatic prenyltransferase [Aspergillus californicus]